MVFISYSISVCGADSRIFVCLCITVSFKGFIFGTSHKFTRLKQNAKKKKLIKYKRNGDYMLLFSSIRDKRFSALCVHFSFARAILAFKQETTLLKTCLDNIF